MSTIQISSATLLGYYQSMAGISTASSSSSGSTTTTAASSAPTPPWSQILTNTQSTAQTSSLIQAAMSGSTLFNPNAAKISVANASPNYKNLFALYQGVTALQDLANQAASTGETASQITQLQTAFAGGLNQLSTFLGASPFRSFSVAQGQVSTQAQTTAGVSTETDVYNTGVLVSGSSNTPVQAFEGNVQFNMTVTLPSGKQTVVNFNLNDMGSTPRSLSNVVSYLNSQLQAAGTSTQFAVERTAGTSTTTKVNGQTLTTPAGPDQFSLQIQGNSVEKISFSAPSSTPAVYMTQTAGSADATTSTTDSSSSSTTSTSDQVQQLVKLTTDPTASNDQVFNDTLSSAVTNAIATATSSDGSVYVLANVDGTTAAGETGAAQSIVGTQDVALMKYDSAGNLLYTNVLGASGAATGYGLSVSPDGSEVAVTGTATDLVTGDGQSSSATTSTGFVSVYSNEGQPLWTNMVGSGLAGQVNQAAFGPNNTLYVAGTTTIPGSTITNNVLVGFSASGTQTSQTTMGTTSQTKITGLAISGSQIVLAGTSNGDAVAQSYQINATGAPTLTATRDLGALDGGSVAGVAVNSDGSIVIAGSTHNGSLNAGTVTNAYTGGEEAFVANLSADLSPSSGDSLTYYAGSGGDVRVTSVTAAGGQAYIGGQVVGTNGAGATTYDGFAAQIDPVTGTSGWSDQYAGLDNTVAPNSIAVSATGSSALDALGLPQGTIDFAPSQTVAASTIPGASGVTVPAQTLVANSALRAGEQFTVKTNFSGVATTITVEANDTLQTLAQKISQATGFEATASVVTGTDGVQQLQIKPGFAGVQITLGSGPTGADALPALGLTQGTLTTNATAKAAKAGVATGAASANSLQANYALNLPSTLNLSTPAGVQQAQTALTSALKTIKQIYTDMTTAPSTSATNNTSTGTAPAYLTAEIASYQAALARLQAANSSSSGSSSLISLAASLG